MILFTDEELVAPVKNLIEKIRPSVRLDGGDIVFLTVKHGTVYIQLRGACKDCDSQDNTLQYTITREIKMNIHPAIEVVNVPVGKEKDIQNL